MYILQEKPDYYFSTINGVRMEPVATLYNEDLGCESHIVIDDGCYVLFIANEDRFKPSTHWFREAVDVLRALTNPDEAKCGCSVEEETCKGCFDPMCGAEPSEEEQLDEALEKLSVELGVIVDTILGNKQSPTTESVPSMLIVEGDLDIHLTILQTEEKDDCCCSA